MLSKDIRFIQMEEGRTVMIGYDPLRKPWNWLFFYVSLGMIFVFIVMEVIWIFREKNQGQIRYKNALKNALSGFNKMEEDQNHAQLLLLIESTFLQYLKDKKFTKDVHKDIPDLIKTIETYKYAPGMLSNLQLSHLKDQALKLVEEIEKNES